MGDREIIPFYCIDLNLDIYILIATHADDKLLSRLSQCSWDLYYVTKSNDLWRRKLELLFPIKFEAKSAINYRYAYIEVNGYLDNLQMCLYVVAAKYGLIPLLDYIGFKEEYYIHAICAAASMDNLESFNYLRLIKPLVDNAEFSVGYSTSLTCFEVVDRIMDDSSQRVLILMIADGLDNKIPILNYAVRIYRLSDSTIINKIFDKLSLSIDGVKRARVMGFDVKDGQVDLSTFYIHACETNNLPLLDTLGILVLSNNKFYVKRGYLYKCNKPSTATHIITSQIHLILAQKLFNVTNSEYLLRNQLLWIAIYRFKFFVVKSLLCTLSQVQLNQVDIRIIYNIINAKKLQLTLHPLRDFLSHRVEELMLYAKNYHWIDLFIRRMRFFFTNDHIKKYLIDNDGITLRPLF